MQSNKSGLVTETVLNTKISELEKKIPHTSSLLATTVLHKKISEVENEIPNNDKQKRKTRVMNILLVENQKVYGILNL